MPTRKAGEAMEEIKVLAKTLDGIFPLSQVYD